MFKEHCQLKPLIINILNILCLSLSLFAQALSGDCGFMAANLYAKSIFGEDALANVSIEIPVDQGPDAPVTGHIRIRAKSQVSVSVMLEVIYKERESVLYHGIKHREVC